LQHNLRVFDLIQSIWFPYRVNSSPIGELLLHGKQHGVFSAPAKGWKGVQMRKGQRKKAKQTERERRAIAATMEKELERLDRVIVTMIRASLADADMTQVALAAKLGLPYREMVNMLSQRKVISASRLILIAQAMNLDPKTLLDRVLSW
jgi:hypothetical protein